MTNNELNQACLLSQAPCHVFPQAKPMTTTLQAGRLSIAQAAYTQATTTARKANPYRFVDQRLSWFAWEIGIYFYDSGRTIPNDIGGRGYTVTVNNIRFQAIVTQESIRFERV